MSERRKFTTDFAVNDRVYVIRTEHGWYDGSLEARITRLEDYYCQVVDDDGCDHEIPKPRDIRLCHHALSNHQEKKRKKRLARARRAAERGQP